jgi:hypothetical protein
MTGAFFYFSKKAKGEQRRGDYLRNRANVLLTIRGK